MISARTGWVGLVLLAAVLTASDPATAQWSVPLPGSDPLQSAQFSEPSVRPASPVFLSQDGAVLSSRQASINSVQRTGPTALVAFQAAQGSEPQPEKETKRRSRMVLMQLLTEGNLPRLGPNNAPVTIVVFSDFECPFCRKLVNILEQNILPSQGKQVQVVYRYFPLTNHPWALLAAEEAGCAAMQSNDEFWALHNKIFEDQKTITKDNAKPQIMELAKSIPGLDFAAFRGCVEKQASLKDVLRDVSLGNMASIYATPTLFVNGWRLDGVATADELKEVIADALRDAQAHPATADPSVKSGAASK